MSPTWSVCRWLTNTLSILDQSGRRAARFSWLPAPTSNRKTSPLPSSTIQLDAFCAAEGLGIPVPSAVTRISSLASRSVLGKKLAG